MYELEIQVSRIFELYDFYILALRGNDENRTFPDQISKEKS